MRKKYSRNFIIGVSFIVSLVLLYFGVNFLKGFNVLKKQNGYVVLFEDVTGLYTSSPIYVNGFQVGLVREIKMHSDNPIQFAVGINLEGNYRIPKGSTVEFASDLLGATAASIVANTSTNELLVPGDTLYGKREDDVMNSVSKIVPKADSLLVHLDSTVVSVNRLMNSPMWEKSLSEVSTTISYLNESSKSLNSMMSLIRKDIPGVTENIKEISSDLRVVSGELSELDLDKIFTSIDNTISNIETLTSRLNSADNSLGKLTHNSQLHDSLTNTLSSVTLLLEEIRENPRKYLHVRVRLF